MKQEEETEGRAFERCGGRRMKYPRVCERVRDKVEVSQSKMSRRKAAEVFFSRISTPLIRDRTTHEQAKQKK